MWLSGKEGVTRSAISVRFRNLSFDVVIARTIPLALGKSLVFLQSSLIVIRYDLGRKDFV